MKSNRIIFLCLSVIILIFSLFSCAVSVGTDELKTKKSDNEIENELNEELADIMKVYSKALSGEYDDEIQLYEEFRKELGEFDKKYQSSLLKEFDAKYCQSRLSGGNDYPALEDLPINKDGAVYLSGGVGSTVSAIIDYVCPTVTSGAYVHGAVLDLNKFDSTNLESQCFQTAVVKGAGYETPDEWMNKANVSVLNPVSNLNASVLNTSQNSMDYYCDSSNTNMQYGFFEDYADVFSLVTKSDNYYWYCTKVVWRVYNAIGINIDSNSSNINWTNSGLYSFVKNYYKVIYFWSSSKAKQKLNEYIDKARSTIVLAEEIYYSPYLTKVYEKIREPN